MNKGMLIFWVGVLFLIVAGVGISFFAKPASGQLDGFAQCLADKDAMFYGAFWCPICQSQKRMFGNSAKLLPYTECSTPDGQSQLQICVSKEIKQYPTWEFSDGSRLTGEAPLVQLAEKTGCELPQK